jgi:hypothetical protein
MKKIAVILLAFVALASCKKTTDTPVTVNINTMIYGNENYVSNIDSCLIKVYESRDMAVLVDSQYTTKYGANFTLTSSRTYYYTIKSPTYNDGVDDYFYADSDTFYSSSETKSGTKPHITTITMESVVKGIGATNSVKIDPTK